MTFYCVSDICDGPTKVMQTGGVHRRRKCLSCGKLFLTEEVEYSIPEGQRNPFTLANEDRRAETQTIIQTTHDAVGARPSAVRSSKQDDSDRNR